MSQLRYLLLACSITFFACSEATGTWEDENTFSLNSSSSSLITNSSAASSSSGTTESSSSENKLSSSEERLSSSEIRPLSSSSPIGIYFPPPVQCAASPRALKAVATYGVVDAFIAKRITVLAEQGLNLDSAKKMATEELYRELGLDSLFQDMPQITDEQLEYTLFFLYKNRENDSTNELSPVLVDDFADGKLEPENYCINGLDFADLDYLPKMYLNLGCVYGDEVDNSLAILRNIWRKCANMPYCNENVSDTIITIGKDHFVCENKSWITLEMQGKEKNGVICTENGTRTIGVGETNNDLTFICHEDYWLSILNTNTLPAEYFFNPDFDYGSFTDPRDGHVYKTTVFNGQTWLAQDMDYYDSSDTLFTKQSKCAKIADFNEHDESENAYCDGASRFYTVNVSKKVCPDGWRLPTKDDWSSIVALNYENGMAYMPKLYVIGSFIRGKDRAATDEFGLSLRMDGKIDPYGRDKTLSGYNLFWLEEGVIAMNSDYHSNFTDIDRREKGEYVPVRCIKK